MSFAVVIPSKNADNFVPCAEAVRRCEPGAEIYLMDDGVNLSFLPNGVMPCDRFAVEKPFIFSRNVNKGIRVALSRGHDGVVILGDDGLLETPGGFSLLAEECRKDPTIGVLGCTTNLGHRCQKPRGEGLRFVEHFAYVAVYIPKATIEKVGFMDERFGGLDELGRTIYGFCDEDMNHRILLAGLKVAVHDGCYVDHGSLRSEFRGDPKNPASLAPGRDVFKAKWPGVHGY